MGAVMPTKLFLHDAANMLNSLPIAEQSSLSPGDDFEGQTKTRVMDLAIGSRQRSISNASTATTSVRPATRFPEEHVVSVPAQEN